MLTQIYAIITHKRRVTKLFAISNLHCETVYKYSLLSLLSYSPTSKVTLSVKICFFLPHMLSHIEGSKW
jgi:hypothetical protein